MSESTPPYKSTVPELRLPEHGFQSTIPKHLLEGCDAQTVWLLTEISKNTAATEFACRGVVELSQHMRELNGKTNRTIERLGLVKADVDGLSDKAGKMEPFFKPMSQFAALWEYRWFRWIVYLAAFFTLTYVYPAYVKSPFDPITIVGKFFGLS